MYVTDLKFNTSNLDPQVAMQLIRGGCDVSAPDIMATELEEIFFTALSSPDYTEFSTSTRGELVFTHRKLLEFLRSLHKAGTNANTASISPDGIN